MSSGAAHSSVPEVAAALGAAPEPQRTALGRLRQLVFDVADEVGAAPVREELTWGQPSYAATHRQESTPIRLAMVADGERFGMFFHCLSSVVRDFRATFPDDFDFDGNRGIVFRPGDDLQLDRLRLCVERALTYRRRRPS